MKFPEVLWFVLYYCVVLELKNSIRTWFQATTDCSKIPALVRILQHLLYMDVPQLYVIHVNRPNFYLETVSNFVHIYIKA